MDLYTTYSQFIRGKITEQEAATAFNVDLKSFRFRISRHGERLPQMLKTLDRISAGQITRDQAAQILACTPRQVNNLQETWGVGRPMKEYLVTKAASKVKWEIRKNYAIEVIADTMSFEAAALSSKVSTRQLRRWVSELLNKHFGIVTRDLAALSLAKRRKMADQIEETEGLTSATQAVAQAVAAGEKVIKQIAAERVQAKRSTKDRQHVRGKPGPTKDDKSQGKA